MILSLILASLPIAFTGCHLYQTIDNNEQSDIIEDVDISNNSGFPSHGFKPYGDYTTWYFETGVFQNSANFDIEFNGIEQHLYFTMEVKEVSLPPFPAQGVPDYPWFELNINANDSEGNTIISNIYIKTLVWHAQVNGSWTSKICNPAFFNGGSPSYTFLWEQSVNLPRLQASWFEITLSKFDSSLINNGIETGFEQGYEQGNNDGYSYGYQTGFNDGVDYAEESNSTALTIFTGIINVALLPVNVFLTILNFEVFGINIGALVTSFLTIAIIVIIIRLVTGKKND